MKEYNLKGRSFLKLLDYSSNEIKYLIDLSKKLKFEKKNGILHNIHKGKNLVLLFEKTSTRTRCAFEVAGADLGMHVTYLDSSSSQMGHKESIEDTAKVLGRMFDGIEYRGYSQDTVEKLAKYSKVPVFNGLTNEFHPTQMIADALTIDENFGKFKGLKLVFLGDAKNNVANSLMLLSAKLGINFIACAPKENMPNDELLNLCKDIAKYNDSTIELISDVNITTKNADMIYTDIWISMGEDKSFWKDRINLLKAYQVNNTVMNNTNENSIFLHCLPSFHDLKTTVGKEIYEKFGLKEMEVTDEVFKSNKSKVFDQAENRLHSIKAIMYTML